MRNNKQRNGCRKNHLRMAETKHLQKNRNEASSGNVASSATTRKDPSSSTGCSPPRNIRNKQRPYVSTDGTQLQ